MVIFPAPVINYFLLLQHLKTQYTDDWEDEVLQEFSFEDSCNELQVNLSTSTVENEATVELLSDMKVVNCLMFVHSYNYAAIS